MAKSPTIATPAPATWPLAAHEALSTPDQDQAADILRRSQEATALGPQTDTLEPTLHATPPARLPRLPRLRRPGLHREWPHAGRQHAPRRSSFRAAATGAARHRADPRRCQHAGPTWGQPRPRPRRGAIPGRSSPRSPSCSSSLWAGSASGCWSSPTREDPRPDPGRAAGGTAGQRPGGQRHHGRVGHGARQTADGDRQLAGDRVTVGMPGSAVHHPGLGLCGLRLHQDERPGLLRTRG